MYANRYKVTHTKLHTHTHTQMVIIVPYGHYATREGCELNYLYSSEATPLRTTRSVAPLSPLLRRCITHQTATNIHT